MKALKISKTNLNLMGIMYLYILFLFFMPNDVFFWTSLKTFSSPPNILYYSITMAYVSLLYIPIIIIGILICIRDRHILKYDALSFFFVLFLKDILISLAFGKDYMFKNSSYEMYWVYIVSISIMAIVLYNHTPLERSFNFFDALGLITISTCVFSLVTGVGTGDWDFKTRYHASSMSSGETAFYLGMFAVYLSACKGDKVLFKNSKEFVFKYRYILTVISIVLIFATGSRKDLIYVVAILVLAKLLFFLKNRNIKTTLKLKKNDFIIFMLIFLLGIVCVVAFIKNDYLERLNLDRMIASISSIFSKNAKQYLEDDVSAIGRTESIIAGLNIVRHNFITGLNFSFFDVQYNMQLLNYPTFPHSTLLFYWCMLGVFIVIPLWMYIKYFILLIKNKSSFAYVLLYVLIHSIISGGAYLDIKSIIQYMLVLSLSICICDNYKVNICFDNNVKLNKEISNE